jgi:hypothetical protein
LKGTYKQGCIVRAKFNKEKEEIVFIDAANDIENDQLKEHGEEVVGTKS